MIRFHSVKYKNFLSTGNKFTEVFLDKRKACLVVGENGSGKSTMLDALCFGLFGKGFRKVSKTMLVNTINGRHMVVEIEFSVGQKRYKVVRGAKPNIFEVYLHGKLLNQDANMRDYQEYLEKQILKLNYKAFTQVVILGSSTFTPFMQMGTNDRRGIIEDILDINIFSIMNDILKVRQGAMKTELQEIEYDIKLSQDRIDTYKGHIKALGENRRQKVADFRDSIANSESHVEDLQVEIDSFLQEVEDNLNPKIKDFEKLKDRLQHTVEIERKLHDAFTKGEEQLDFYEHTKTCPTCKHDLEDDFKEKKLEEIAGTNTEITRGIKELEQKVASLEKQLEDIQEVQEQINDINRKVSKKQNEISASQQYITKINKEIDKLVSEKQSDDSKKLGIETKALKKHDTRKEELVDKRHYYDLAAFLLKDSGIKTKIVKQYLPVMNKLINKYLASMDFFVQFELDENFNEKIKSRYRDDFSYANFSEGEKMRIDLALLFTWRAIAKLKNSVNTNLLMLDEVFDSSLDEGGTDEFMKILTTLGNDTNVFIISHKGDILNEKFRHVMKFEKVKNFSRIAE